MSYAGTDDDDIAGPFTLVVMRSSAFFLLAI